MTPPSTLAHYHSLRITKWVLAAVIISNDSTTPCLKLYTPFRVFFALYSSYVSIICSVTDCMLANAESLAQGWSAYRAKVIVLIVMRRFIPLIVHLILGTASQSTKQLTIPLVILLFRTWWWLEQLPIVVPFIMTLYLHNGLRVIHI